MLFKTFFKNYFINRIDNQKVLDNFYLTKIESFGNNDRKLGALYRLNTYKGIVVKFHRFVLDTDYHNYLIVYHSVNNNQTEGNFQYISFQEFKKLMNI